MNEIPVLFENGSCIVFNKPAGLAVQGGKGIKNSLDSLLAERYRFQTFLVHRLDRDTSGIILVAKTKEAAAGFSALFSGKEPGRKMRLVKKYIAVVKGIPVPEKGGISLPLEIKGRMLKSETFYRLASSAVIGGRPCSLLDLELGSGRMHQLRRHLSLVGHPVLGDGKYGDFALNKTLQKTAKLKRLLLHSSSLSMPAFPPFVPDGFEIKAPPPEHFTELRLDNGLSFFT